MQAACKSRCGRAIQLFRIAVRLFRERRVADEGISLAFAAEARRGSVPGYEADIIAERPQLVADRIDQILMIAAREIGAANRALKQNVTY